MPTKTYRIYLAIEEVEILFGVEVDYDHDILPDLIAEFDTREKALLFCAKIEKN